MHIQIISLLYGRTDPYNNWQAKMPSTLSLIKSSDSTIVILNVIRELTGDTTYAEFDATVSAKINGEKKIDGETIRIYLTNSRPNFALIDIVWEDFGYRNYKDMGLFGRMSTQWQEVKKIKAKTFRVFGGSYEIDVDYQAVR